MSASPTGQLAGALPGLRRTLGHVRPHLRPQRRLVVGGFAALFAEVAFRLLEPWPLKVVLDAVIAAGAVAAVTNMEPSGDSTADVLRVVLIASLAVVALAGLRALAAYAMTVCFSLAGSRAMTGVRATLFDHLQRLSLRFHRGTRSGDLLNRLVGDVGRVQEVAVTAGLPLLGNVVTLVGMLVVMLVLDATLAIVVVVALVLFAVGVARQGPRITRAARRQRSREGDLAGAANETLGAMVLVQAYGLRDHLSGRFASSNDGALRDGVKASRMSAALERGTDVLVGVAAGAVLLIGARQVVAGSLTPGELTVFVSYLKSAFKPMRDLAKYTGRIAKAAASGERISDLLEAEVDVRDTSWARQPRRVQGAVTLEGVSTSYGDGRYALRDVSVHVPAGRRVGLLGPSGAGKSTLVSLLPRLQDPVAGCVRLDGVDLRDLTLDGVRDQVAIVLQDSVLFATSIAENISYGRPGATREEIERAARDAGAHDFVVSMPQGYDTVVGERGGTLSGGQRQRIAVARAILRDAPVVVLDEATTGLDRATADGVREALLRLTAGRTTFVITHEPDDVATCDLVLWIEGGRIADRGTPQEILARHAAPAGGGER
ncbi:ABC transporter ATP-binding protein [Litorihabitans aurantiacus]|uniref:Protein-tyrosine-phosphatase n=1 Tax=Litorihabitans aurantiacus TaxID=1930061 RepID=A0AA37XIH1_9MICO|nr:ABC transporter ATP-binding protein [Litorihabitans aurantiacus]GMA33456.1 protein-tyrosine-phosphatase [Litorihabitans aurantiacus]